MRLVGILGHRSECVGQGPQIEVIGIEAVGPLASGALDNPGVKVKMGPTVIEPAEQVTY
jgi:predicted Fe-Mo cluster-binding NifX family protein